MSKNLENFIDVAETCVTLILLAEIIIRFVVDWRHFFFSKRNLADLLIAIVTTVIQIPAVKNSHDGRAYAWLTVFQILRTYRLVLAVQMTRDLIVSSSRLAYSFANMRVDDCDGKRWRFAQSHPLCVSSDFSRVHLSFPTVQGRDSNGD